MLSRNVGCNYEKNVASLWISSSKHALANMIASVVMWIIWKMRIDFLFFVPFLVWFADNLHTCGEDAEKMDAFVPGERRLTTAARRGCGGDQLRPWACSGCRFSQLLSPTVTGGGMVWPRLQALKVLSSPPSFWARCHRSRLCCIALGHGLAAMAAKMFGLSSIGSADVALVSPAS